MKIDVLTLFPNMFSGFLTESIIKRAVDKELVKINIQNLREYASNKHKKVDDTPYGGGAGMVLMCQPVFDAVKKLKKKKSKVILLTPQGQVYNQEMAYQLKDNDHLIFICGHYEGFDERIRSIVDTEISIGDYVLTGGEIPSMVVMDSVIRLVDGVIDESSHINDSFLDNLLDYPTYTKPAVYEDMKVPDVLLSGDHKKIEKWRQTERIIKTLEKRPDLINNNKFLVEKNINHKEWLFFEVSSLKGLDITPKNDAKRNDVISVNKMILIKPSFIDKVIKLKIDKKIKNIYNKYAYLMTTEDEEGTAAVLEEALRYRDYILNYYISFLGEQYRDLITKKLQIIINELGLKLRFINEIKQHEINGKSR